MTKINEKMAMVAGVNAGIVGALIEKLITEKAEDTSYKYGRFWCRASMKTMGVYCPFLTERQIETALKQLQEHGIISKGSFNKSRFDRTNWYAFTEYGERLREKGGEAIGQKGKTESVWKAS